MTLSHDVSGHGPALVLLHSSVCDRRMWDPQWPVLAAAGYRVIRCDFRGFGDSPAADHPYGDAGDVMDLLDHLGIERAALAGASYGGQVALEVAAARPDAVTALVLLCSALPGHAPGPALRSFAEREEALFEAGDLAGAVELNVATWLGPEAGDGVRERVRRMQRHAFEVQLTAEFAPAERQVDLARIEAPSLAVSGAHDLPDFREIAAHLADRIPGARHLELPWAGHLPGLERPGAVADLLTRFLRETAPGA
ncbi:alpha/beta fold hydrolase [Streptomyces botrytidirepellens]|uniref:Alpha/beta fold hydrolase n=1 Tax=Streptomyces botrytidirepellens TaxID=2486417 RepID=A0A3M8W7P8_9ACTN|nr:alpha/beta fold hydrolase [Streptomyces botrytidirepellens]RNG24505.1 alpha/beta fold hydrolase [Streptomyces botrytidirepellens]